MKIISVLISLFLGMGLCVVDAQVINDPLFNYYQHITKPDFDPQADSFHYSSQTQVYCFEADFTGSNEKSVFITDEGEYLGAHGKYAWSVYCPLKSGGYQLVTNDGDFIMAGLNGPAYVGYISQIKGYGVIIGERYSVAAYYLENGTIQSKALDLEREHANEKHYPEYFRDKPVKRDITTYTLGQLAQKYGTPAPASSGTPAGK